MRKPRPPRRLLAASDHSNPGRGAFSPRYLAQELAAFCAHHPRNRHWHHHGHHRYRGDQRPQRKCSRRHSRAWLGYHHRLPLPLGFSFPPAKRMVYAQGTSAGVGRRHRQAPARQGRLRHPCAFFSRNSAPAPKTCAAVPTAAKNVILQGNQPSIGEIFDLKDSVRALLQ